MKSAASPSQKRHKDANERIKKVNKDISLHFINPVRVRVLRRDFEKSIWPIETTTNKQTN